MSREVRRVPLDWKHPVEPNPYWREQSIFLLGDRAGIRRPASRLRDQMMRFIGLSDNYQAAFAYWQNQVADVKARTGHRWKFNVEYHLTGWKSDSDIEPVVHPYYDYVDGEEVAIPVRDEDHLYELEVAKVDGEKPDPANFMPTFDGPVEALGWCLYETTSEGTPVTPVFATAAELVDWLATVGEDYDQVPYRREAAERVVGDGFTMGTFVAVGGQILDSAKDADRLRDDA